MNIETVPLDSLSLDPANARLHPALNLEGIKGSLRKFGQQKPIVVGENGVVIAGNGQLLAARELGWTGIAIVRSSLKGSDATAYGIADNATGLSSEWDKERLTALVESLRAEDYEMPSLGLSMDDLDALAGRAADEADALLKPKMSDFEARQTLAARFGVPPFSVLDARQGYWQERKNAWLALGLRSFEGRKQGLTYDGAGAKPPSFYALRNEMREAAGGVDPSWEQINAEAMKRGMASAAIDGTSIFDPVLCELCYRWFCPPAGMILDPFAGGSARGLVAAKLGRKYLGVDLSEEQVRANRSNWAAFEQFTLKGGEEEAEEFPVWRVGDSTQLDGVVGECDPFDFVFSCPPYADLEVYSDDSRDLSTMKYEDFLKAYFEIIRASVARLKPDRFACFVVGDVRDKKGLYRGFVPDTIRAFEEAGAHFYNDAILITQVGSGAIRAGKMFTASRKMCKGHQNVLVFVKGDPKRATEAVGPCEWGEITDAKTALEEGGLEVSE